jgi:hypothetical protein
VDVFEEGDEGDEFFVFDVAFPFFEDDGIFGLFFGVGGDGVDHDYFGQIAVEIGEVLGMC